MWTPRNNPSAGHRADRRVRRSPRANPGRSAAAAEARLGRLHRLLGEVLGADRGAQVKVSRALVHRHSHPSGTKVSEPDASDRKSPRHPLTDPCSSAVMTWRWNTMKTMQGRKQDQDRPGAEQAGCPSRSGPGRRRARRPSFAGSGPPRGRGRAGTGSTPTPTSGSRATPSGARASGTWIRQNRSQVLAPSTRAASEISFGMLTKWARIQNTANGMNRPISGRTIASRVFRIPIWRARK